MPEEKECDRNYWNVYARKNAESTTAGPGMTSQELRQRARKAALKMDYGGDDAARRNQAVAAQHAWGGNLTDFATSGGGGFRGIRTRGSFYSENDHPRSKDLVLGATSGDRKRISVFLEDRFGKPR
eukprot:GEMP01050001.1.p1 GENE.GEMP01050001.1~~GEMP01050001.1.p1  ORF type:complete len:126 (+),score=39.21 GEMP01050001.1:154-531(+)